ncbi:MAG: hypothetical protein ACFE0I_00385 [Elainellaceae cyanobacterium]
MTAKLVSIGDSLTQGFLSGSISKTSLSFPAMIARCLGDEDFTTPDLSGEGGLPLNLEALLHRLANRYGDRINWFEAIPALLTARSFMDDVEDYWERGDGSQPLLNANPYRNLAVWGFQLGDCDTVSEKICRSYIPRAKDHFLQQIPEFSQYLTVRRTLNPSFDPRYQSLTQIDIAQKIAREDGLENLIFWLGGNHCLGTVIRLSIEWSTEAEIDKLPHERKANLWRPEHFRVVLHRAAEKVAAIGADHVFVGNIPHVTIPPISRGVSPGAAPGQRQDPDGYFEYYTHFWIWDSDFTPDKYPCLTRAQIREIDAVIDEYNQLIQDEVERRSWHLVDMCQVLDQLAFRRQHGDTHYQFPPDLVAALKANPATQDRVTPEGHVLLDTRYARIDAQDRDPTRQYQGGLFSLDGIHPSTIGYGLSAHEYLKVMKQAWADAGKTVETSPLDWKHIVANDSLVVNPPANLGNLQDTLGFLYSQTPLPKLLEVIGGLTM